MSGNPDLPEAQINPICDLLSNMLDLKVVVVGE